jgi:hypothetical protein
MTIQEAVKKSIEHGYSLRGIGPSGFYELLDRYSSDVFLDPLFWQSLGKAMGWEFVSKERKVQYTKNHKLNSYSQEWLYQWHRFIDHLAEGKDAESFFENTLTK